MTEGSTDLQTVSHHDALAPYQPRSLEEAFKLATYFAGSYLLGDLNTPERVLLVMACAAELAIPVTAALRGFVVIEGRLAMRAYLKVALVMSKPECEYFRLVESTDQCAVYETKRRGRDPRPWRYTVEEARAAGLPTDAHLLRSRCASALCTAEYPNIGFGLPAVEDLAVGAAPFGRDEDLPLSATPQIVALPLVMPERESNSAPQPTDTESSEARMARWKQTLETCATSREADRVLVELGGDFPDPRAPERKEVIGWHAATMARLAQAPRASKRRASAEQPPGQQEIDTCTSRDAQPEAEAK